MPYSHSDKRLSDEIGFGSEAGFECFFKRYYPRLCAYAYRFTDNEDLARDLVQDCFARLWEKRTQLHALHPKTLIFTMVRNACLNHLRHRKVVIRYQMEYMSRIGGEEKLYSFDFLSDAEQPYLYHELEREIQQIVDSLPAQCREVFLLSRFEGLKNRQIAHRLNISETAVEKHISKALTRISEQLRRRYSFEMTIVALACLMTNYF